MKTGDEIQSIDFSIGGSKFYIGIHPNGDEHKNNEFLSVYIRVFRKDHYFKFYLCPTNFLRVFG